MISMRHGWAYIYEAPPAETRFEELIETHAGNGISLARPGSGEIAMLSPEGDTIVCSKQDILKKLTESIRVSMQLYLDDCSSTFCAIEKVGPDVIRESYSLSGKNEEKSLHVIRSLVQLFGYRAARGIAFALVVDRYAELHRNFHWDDFALGSSAPPEWPMLLGFAKNFRRLQDVPPSYRTVDEGTYLLLTSKTPKLAD